MLLPLTSLDEVRNEIGTATPPTDDDLTALRTEGLSWSAVALRIVKRRLADFRTDPSSLSGAGFALGTAANITSLEKQVADLQALVDAEGADGQLEYGQGRMVRAGWR